MTRRIIRSGPAATRACHYCIDGFQPDSIHPVLGPVYTHCCACLTAARLPICRSCLSNCWFPADRTDMHRLVEHCEELGYLIVWCGKCSGITHLVPIDLAAGGDQP